MKDKVAAFFLKAFIYCKFYIDFCVWLLVFAVGIRFFEALLLTYQAKYDFIPGLVWNLTGLYYDISLFLRLSVWGIIIYIAASFFSEKITRTVFRIALSLLLLLSLIGIAFFATSGYLLDKAVFTYSFKEIITIIQSSSKSPVWVYAVMIVLPVLYFFLSGKRIKINRWLFGVFTLLTLSSFFILPNIHPNTNQYHVKKNKAYFFLNSVFIKQISSFNDENIYDAVKEFRSFFPEHRFVEPDYPFLYQAECKDVLSPFLNLNAKPPHIVIIIIEGLGYDIFNNNIQLMPFLDSLSEKSLMWKNCLSVSPRTFGIMPGILGNAPLGEKGFLDICPYSPEYYSLPRILHQNSYTNFFFHGGDPSWMKLDKFSQENNLNYLKESDWEQDIKKRSVNSKWGYEDHLLYEQAQRKINQQPATPRLDIYLSQSTHDPFEYSNSAHFQNMAKNKINESRSLSEEQKKFMLNWLPLYGSFIYADRALQQLMESYKQRADFDNTIFVITGDHHVFSKQFGGFFNYHVPLIIYSPMLKSYRKMKGVVSHRDITPTLLSLLHNNFDFKTPKEVAWLNSALDTSITFNANTFSFLQAAARTGQGVLYKDYLLCEDILEKLTDSIPLKIEDTNSPIYKQMNRLLFLYKMLDSYALENDVLLRKEKSDHLISETILHIEDTIAKRSYYADRSALPVVKGPEGRNTTLYFDSENKQPINFINYSFLDDNVERLRITVNFDVYIASEIIDFKVPSLIISIINDNNESVLYNLDYLSYAPSNQWHSYKYAFNCPKEEFKQSLENCFLKVFLWNSFNSEAYMDNIKVKFIIERKKQE